MIHLDAATLAQRLPYPALIEALRVAFAASWTAPERARHALDGTGATLLLMPAWRADRFVGVKIVNVFPGNAARGIPSVSSLYVLSDAASGRMLALLDGECLTARRTAAASALAASFLARCDARHLLVVGAGRVAAELAAAYAAVRPIESVSVWSRTFGNAQRMAAAVAEQGFAACAVEDLAGAVAAADVVSCATLSTQPLIAGAWLRPGTHLDLIGSFKPTMREVDDAAVERSLVAVDTAAALHEAGDLVQPIVAGVIERTHVAADLYDLCRGRHRGRQHDAQITLFKSVGHAIEDLAAASLAYEAAAGGL